MAPTIVVGGGIVGLAVARALQDLRPDQPVVVLEKETQVAAHQTGHNSGVIHSGLYYKPGSLKARLAVTGAEQMKQYCEANGITYDVPGKLVVASSDRELAQLDRLLGIGRENGVPVRMAEPGEIEEREPEIRVRAALVVDSTGRVNYRDVAASLARDVRNRGGEIRLGVAVSSVTTAGSGAVVHTSAGDVEAERVAVCGGLHADRIARASGIDPGVRILPFRGEYSELLPDRAWLVKGLVYPVPDPDLPFLGVHLTRGIDGVVHIGPNAVPALAREGYTWSAISPRDLWDSLTYRGSWRLARRYGRIGAQEMARSLAGRALVKAAQEMLPPLQVADVRKSMAGVRAQAVARDGSLVDDFMFKRSGPTLHVLNAPSPAATACLPIGAHIAQELYRS
jgi:L-2-hydroxyglutarate oxidase|nr:hydroxyglutarate oxidase [Aeromicrobium sp.]